MATSSYEPMFPNDAKVDAKLKAFISEFYSVSDEPDKNEKWVSYFAPNAVLVMGDKVAQGTQGKRAYEVLLLGPAIGTNDLFMALEIHGLRRGMWETVKSRKHHPLKVFPASFPTPADTQLGPETGVSTGTARGTSMSVVEYMLYGSLDLALKSGDVSKVSWAGHAVLQEDGEGALKFALYQVYLHKDELQMGQRSKTSS